MDLLLIFKNYSFGGGNLKFVKTQAIGNDFILVERAWLKNLKPEELAPKLCDRHFGIGSDGILIVDKENALYKMTMLNPDGSTAMCGNGLRAFIRYLLDEKYITENEFEVKTEKGIHKVKSIKNQEGSVEKIEVNLGYPIFEREKIPFAKSGDEPAINEKIIVEGKIFEATLLSMGNPHAVIFTNDVEKIDINYWGSRIENHRLFPKRTNVEFVQVVDRNTLIMRVWERGAGITLACGTGTSASVVAAVLKGLTNSKVIVKLEGGELEVQYEKGKEVIMIGYAEEVFRGKIEPAKIKLPK